MEEIEVKTRHQKTKRPLTYPRVPVSGRYRTGTPHQSSQPKSSNQKFYTWVPALPCVVLVRIAENLQLANFNAKILLPHHTESVLRLFCAKTTRTCSNTLQICQQVSDAEISQLMDTRVTTLRAWHKRTKIYKNSFYESFFCNFFFTLFWGNKQPLILHWKRGPD